MPEILTKNGALPGFSSQIFLVPSRQLAVVALVKSETAAPAQALSFNIGYALLNALPL